MGQLVITNGNVLLPDGKLQRSDVLVEDGKITTVAPDLTASSSFDAAGACVLPGFIDLHTHGIGFHSTDSESLRAFAALEATRGTTTFFPTYFGPPQQTIADMERHRRETDDLRQLPQIGGFRLESPYLARTGAGVSDDLAPISRDITDALLHVGGGHIKIWDFSPELPGACDEIRYLAEQGIVCSLAHTQATIAQARAAVDAGARLVTHLYDTFVVPEMVDPGVYPVGLIDYFLVEDRVTCEIIGDGVHVHPLHIEKTFRCKSPERIVFVTDSNFGAGLPAGEYVLPNSWGRIAVNGSNNGVRLIDREMGLAGSALTPIDAFRNAVNLFGCKFAVASQICSTTPARLLGLNKGEIRAGKDADFVVLDTDLNLLATIVAGQVIYQS
ncbi:MAG: N-acetylglucosamine-6-phosphate deacetylase [Armatimonadota bacterium]